MSRAKVNKDESSREKFKRLAEYRTKRVLEALRILGHCSNSYVYTYEDVDIQKIFEAIEKELEKTKMRFKGDSSCTDFKL